MQFATLSFVHACLDSLCFLPQFLLYRHRKLKGRLLIWKGPWGKEWSFLTWTSEPYLTLTNSSTSHVIRKYYSGHFSTPFFPPLISFVGGANFKCCRSKILGIRSFKHCWNFLGVILFKMNEFGYSLFLMKLTFLGISVHDSFF